MKIIDKVFKFVKGNENLVGLYDDFVKLVLSELSYRKFTMGHFSLAQDSITDEFVLIYPNFSKVVAFDNIEGVNFYLSNLVFKVI